MMKNNFAIILTGTYLLFSIGAYVLVFKAPADGLANLPLILVNVPIIFLERYLTNTFFGSMDGYLWEPIIKLLGLPRNYYLSHILWFLPLTVFNTYIIFKFGSWLQKKLKCL